MTEDPTEDGNSRGLCPCSLALTLEKQQVAASHSLPPHFLPLQDDPREVFLSASKQIGRGQTKAADSDKLKLRETRVTMPVRGLFLSQEMRANSQSLVMARSGLGHLGTHGFG